MFKYFFFIFILFAFTNCAAPGSALLGPAFTGATTKSLTQASLSFGTNQIARKLHSTSEKTKNKISKIVQKVKISKEIHN